MEVGGEREGKAKEKEKERERRREKGREDGGWKVRREGEERRGNGWDESPTTVLSKAMRPRKRNAQKIAHGEDEIRAEGCDTGGLWL